MCRLAAYCGPHIALEKIIVAPKHSLLEQSQSANEAKLAVNGDGFGIAWYGENHEPGLYRDILPAWSDGNLPNLCRMIKSHLFLAHVRASTTGEVSRVNCHPFVHKHMAFMHNGQIAGFEDKRRKLEAELPDELYRLRRGSTDSELLFLLLLANGLEESPKCAFEKTIKLIQKIEPSTTQPNRLSCVFCNGEQLFAFRHSSDECSPTLYVSKSLDSGGRAVASEPLDGNAGNWLPVPDNQFIAISGQTVMTEPLYLLNEFSMAI